MFHTVRQGSLRAVGPVVLLLALTQATAAAQKPSGSPARPASPSVGQAESAPIPQDSTAEQTRTQLELLLEKYPPAVGRVLKLDPSLMTNQAYMATYPLLSNYIAQHPEISRNPSYFLENVNSPNPYYNDPRSRQRQQFYDLLSGVAGFIVFLVMTGLLVWVIRLIVTTRRWNKLSKVQYEVHSKLLDRFTANEDLLAYMQTPAGRRFLEAAPVRLPEEPRSMAAPLSRILWSVQVGVVLLLTGIGLLYVSSTFIDEPAELFRVLGVVSLALGGGFVVSAVAAYVLSRRLGLLDPAPADNA
ncbi:MAG TPA: hypothetical protein VFT39_22195 [Vicinamibacterales bacterium]|nr:hypothetical protein [Vicinamibacterales bacterium]